MKLKAICGLAALVVAGAAYAYTLECSGDACKVYCDNKQYVGTMYWNGTNWSDGLRSDPSKEEVASERPNVRSAN